MAMRACLRRWRAVERIQRRRWRPTSVADRWAELMDLVAYDREFAGQAVAKRKRTQPRSRAGTAGSISAAHSAEPSVLPFREATIALLRWYEHTRLTGAVIGGVAVALLGRYTRDLDAVELTTRDDWAALFSSAHDTRLVPRATDPIGKPESAV
jgi:hypothetical protein